MNEIKQRKRQNKEKSKNRSKYCQKNIGNTLSKSDRYPGWNKWKTEILTRKANLPKKLCR